MGGERKKQWEVITQVTQQRTYLVSAENEKAAIEESCNASADYEEDFNEETMSVREVCDGRRC